jgi:dihydrofolate reductase
VSGVEVHGYAIVSADDRIADAAGALPDSLRNEADWAYFQAELDRADFMVLGRASHEAAPNVRRRRRIVVSRASAGLEEREDGLWWRPEAVGFAELAARLLPGGGRLAVPGGQGVFDLFLRLGYAAFHLARAEGVTLTGGRGIFAADAPADATLRGGGLTPGRKRWLDEAARVSLMIYRRDAKRSPGAMSGGNPADVG